MEIEKKNSFPAEDGHIESIWIGVDQVKVSFQTWDLSISTSFSAKFSSRQNSME